ncbi:MAG TPA: sialidase family protein [archaeon]|nr:sialidase family protein [archaeon]
MPEIKAYYKKISGLARAAVFLFLFTGTISAAGDEKPFYRAELIFKPTLRFPRCHSSAIIALPDGSLMAAWWNGSEEGANDVVIRASRRPKGKEGWEIPRILADTPDTTEGNPVFFLAPNGELWLFYRAGLPWARLMWIKSPDIGQTWGKPTVFLDQPGWSFRSRALLLSSGDIFIPTMTHGKSAFTPTGSSTVFTYSIDGGKTWSRTEEIITEPRSNEAAIIQRSDGSLLAFMRPYDPEPEKRYLWQSESFDQGRRWSEARRTTLKNPSSAIELLTLQSGHIVLAFNDSQQMRSPLCLALSLDQGRTWSYKRTLEDAPGRFSYPGLTQAADGHIHVSYTFRRTHIKHAEVNEAWIMERPWRD